MQLALMRQLCLHARAGLRDFTYQPALVGVHATFRYASGMRQLYHAHRAAARSARAHRPCTPPAARAPQLAVLARTARAYIDHQPLPPDSDRAKLLYTRHNNNRSIDLLSFQ